MWDLQKNILYRDGQIKFIGYKKKVIGNIVYIDV